MSKWTRISRVITTSAGTTVRIIHTGGNNAIICDNPAAPHEFRHQEVGRVIDGGFQPAPLAAFGLRPEVLRAVADLIEETTSGDVPAAGRAHEHSWVETTRLSDEYRYYACDTCPATREEPRP